MTQGQSYITDLFSIFPSGAICYIQAPDLNNPEILNLMLPTTFEYYKELKLTELNKEKLMAAVVKENIESDFQSIEIRVDDKLLFAGYDGMEYGIISKTLELPVWFIEKYANSEMYSISKEW